MGPDIHYIVPTPSDCAAVHDLPQKSANVETCGHLAVRLRGDPRGSVGEPESAQAPFEKGPVAFEGGRRAGGHLGEIVPAA